MQCHVSSAAHCQGQWDQRDAAAVVEDGVQVHVSKAAMILAGLSEVSVAAGVGRLANHTRPSTRASFMGWQWLAKR